MYLLSAAAHASHQWVSNEKKPEAHRLERHDAGTASGYSQWPALPDWKWVRNTHTNTQKSPTSILNSRNEQESEWGKTCSCILTPTLYSGCESTFIYVSKVKELYQLTASPEHLLLPHCTDHRSWYSGMNNFLSYTKNASRNPHESKHHELVFSNNRLSLQNLLLSVLHVVWKSWRNNQNMWCENNHNHSCSVWLLMLTMF